MAFPDWLLQDPIHVASDTYGPSWSHVLQLAVCSAATRSCECCCMAAWRLGSEHFIMQRTESFLQLQAAWPTFVCTLLHHCLC